MPLDELSKPPATPPPLRSHGGDAMTLECPPATLTVKHKRLGVVTINRDDFDPALHERISEA